MGPETEYALIPLTKGQVAVVDLLDCGLVNQNSWRANRAPSSGKFYAITTIGKEPHRRIVKMHRLITGVTDPKIQVDHANLAPLDNRQRNLRVATHAQNQMNRTKHRDNTSGFKGVNFSPRHRKWLARISTPLGRLYLGLFATRKQASEAYTQAAQKYHGDFARTV